MITGYNTDVEYDGVTYHVQTEDKGLESPVLLSLVYLGGAIIASKRTRYDDLVADGFDDKVLSERLQRQHTLICAAIRAGRIDDLKTMSSRDPAGRSTNRISRRAPRSTERMSPTPDAASGNDTKEIPVRHQSRLEDIAPSKKRSTVIHVQSVPSARRVLTGDLVDLGASFIEQEEVSGLALVLSLLDEKTYRGGDRVTLRVLVVRGIDNRVVVGNADVVVKVLGSTFRPQIFQARTGDDGIATVNTKLPHFRSGRAAILLRATVGAEEAELRRIVQQG